MGDNITSKSNVNVTLILIYIKISYQISNLFSIQVGQKPHSEMIPYKNILYIYIKKTICICFYTGICGQTNMVAQTCNPSTERLRQDHKYKLTCAIEENFV